MIQSINGHLAVQFFTTHGLIISHLLESAYWCTLAVSLSGNFALNVCLFVAQNVFFHSLALVWDLIVDMHTCLLSFVCVGIDCFLMIFHEWSTFEEEESDKRASQTFTNGTFLS